MEYFDVSVLYSEKMMAHFGSMDERVIERISTSVFDNIIDGLLGVNKSDWKERRFLKYNYLQRLSAYSLAS